MILHRTLYKVEWPLCSGDFLYSRAVARLLSHALHSDEEVAIHHLCAWCTWAFWTRRLPYTICVRYVISNCEHFWKARRAACHSWRDVQRTFDSLQTVHVCDWELRSAYEFFHKSDRLHLTDVARCVKYGRIRSGTRHAALVMNWKNVKYKGSPHMRDMLHLFVVRCKAHTKSLQEQACCTYQAQNTNDLLKSQNSNGVLQRRGILLQSQSKAIFLKSIACCTWSSF